MTLTNSQQEAISTAKENYKKVEATFEVMGESKFYNGKVICKLTYKNGSNCDVMVGKRGAFEWGVSFNS